ncbi:hypothetical protein [Anoxybacillus ayderensis]|uniref:hypothetical protein n=1 Tax=Anoxybacillus ayderensis TaxID=265546 RepID=UPI000A26F9DC|nr:hypothetical protein [Anoxybacillus ayderensis]OSX54782.1 hypothetical protein B7H16_04795 [Anoxybacillus ayderensis]
MLIKPFRKYIVLCKGPDQKTYRWHLNVQPEFKAWKIANEDVQIGQYFKGYLILSIDDITDKPTTISNDFLHEKSHLKKFDESISQDELDLGLNDEKFTKHFISLDEFDIDSIPSYGSSSSCEICGGTVRNGVCTTCMFDWDS